MTPSMAAVAPAPICTVHWVKPVTIVGLLIVAVHPFAAADTAAVFPDERVLLVWLASAAQSGAYAPRSEK